MKYKGVVVWFNSKSGIGFIKKDAADGEGDVFVHYSNIECDGFKSLEAGQEVEYELGANHRGPQAVKVSVLS